MDKDSIKTVLNGMFDSIQKEKIELFERVIGESHIDKIEDIQDFYYGLIYPYDKFLSGLIKTRISDNNDIEFILKNSRTIEHHFIYWIEKKEGSACCADKTRTILRRLVEYYETGKEIEFDYTQEYTFGLPKIVFKTHGSIIDFYESVRDLYYGNPTKYLNEIKKIIA